MSKDNAHRDYVKEFRDKQAAKFIAALEQDGTNWVQHWQNDICRNGSSNREYTGVNQISLMLSGHKDPRWFTFSQIIDLGHTLHPGVEWHLKKGSRGEGVEFWFPVDLYDHQEISWADYDRAQKEPDFDADRYALRARHFTVFNAEDIEGIEPYHGMNISNARPEQAVKDLAAGMGVPVIYDQKASAFYRPSTDEVHLPQPQQFDSQADLDMTTLHELSHASGSPKRLDRPNQNEFGSPEYAFEELIAEITSVFMAARIPGVITTAPSFENNEAYVAGWIQAIEDRPEALMDAIRSAQKAAEYMDNALDRETERRHKFEQSVEPLFDALQTDNVLRADVSTAMQSALNAYAEYRPDIHTRSDFAQVIGDHMRNPDDRSQPFVPGDRLAEFISGTDGLNRVIANTVLAAIERTDEYRSLTMNGQSLDNGTLVLSGDEAVSIVSEYEPAEELVLERTKDEVN